jgi:hypothetical protein
MAVKLKDDRERPVNDRLRGMLADETPSAGSLDSIQSDRAF